MSAPAGVKIKENKKLIDVSVSVMSMLNSKLNFVVKNLRQSNK